MHFAKLEGTVGLVMAMVTLVDISSKPPQFIASTGNLSGFNLNISSFHTEISLKLLKRNKATRLRETWEQNGRGNVESRWGSGNRYERNMKSEST